MSQRGSQIAAETIANDLSGSLYESGPSRTSGYQARIEITGQAEIESAYERLEIAIAANRFDNGVVIGLKAFTKNYVKIESPNRGIVRRKDFGTTFSPLKVGSGVVAFGNQLGTIEAFGGEVKRIEVHVIHPPKGKRVIGWKLV